VKSGRAIAKLIFMVALLPLPSRSQFRADTVLSVLRVNDVVFASKMHRLISECVDGQDCRDSAI